MRKNGYPPRRGIAFRPTLSGLFLMSTCLFAQHTYYISKSLGSDSNTSTQAQTKSTPWQHLPGMAGCTGTGCSVISAFNCSPACKGPGNGYTPVAGDQFILYGGDTWGASDLGVSWGGSGSSSASIYIGVDQTWYNSSVCGSSWCRPIFNAQGTVLSGTSAGADMIFVYADYLTIDNIELTGFHTSGGSGGSIVGINDSSGNGGDIVEHLYIHGWSHAASGDTDNAFAISAGNGSLPNSCIQYNVIDGSDTTKDMLGGLQSTIPCAAGNVIKYVTNGIQGSGQNWYNNVIGPIVTCFSGCHQNAIFNFTSISGSGNIYIYNNIVTGTFYYGGTLYGGSGGGIWLAGNGAFSGTGYVFNNLMYSNSGAFTIGLGGHNALNYGTWYVFNNTEECGNDVTINSGTGSCGGDGGGATGETFNLTAINNHFITGDGGSTPILCQFGIACSFTTNLNQTLTAANTQGYNDTTETYAFSPGTISGSTVGAGTNQQSLCTTIAGLNGAAGAACASDLRGVARPASAAWDIGAYQYQAGGSTIPPSAPPSLSWRLQ